MFSSFLKDSKYSKAQGEKRKLEHVKIIQKQGMHFVNYLHVDTLLSHGKMSLAGRSGRAPSKGIFLLRQ